MVLAGLFAGLTEAIVVNPFEVVKVRQQTDQQQFFKVNILIIKINILVFQSSKRARLKLLD